MQDLQEPHLTAMKHILSYLHGTPNFGLLWCRSSGSDLVAYTDADWAAYPDTHHSMSSYAVFLRDNLVCQAEDYHLPVQCGSRVPRHGQWCG
jgi:hypothetical protein